MFEKKFGLGIMGAAALAACSPEADTTGADRPEATSVMQEAGNGDLEITIAEENGEPQYTPEQEAEILSGTTKENDSMSSEDLEKLTPPE